MADPLTPQISDRICKHMNEDHADAILLYAKVYGKAATATSAEMLSIDAEGMNLAAQIEGQSQNLRIPFDHALQDSEDAHQTLIGMVRSARQQAG
ncbi:MAG TPA: DUF2470 domain-containing protein [Leptolyngbyaceae cyanobacterium M33_DOE_097]|uniref:DUF2470 domain-containing protein n=1 Tax=Oscillatoriales cyanobacterium SpSt-418 TaxID=2282169 RepID=A0A7C3PJH9_9CYAN|nr:DUF2470 domain-containing protein [Leptolyngbyaceae cyanobacterium M33_DOE_097]